MPLILSDSPGSHCSFPVYGAKLLTINGGLPRSVMPDLLEAQLDALHAQMNPHFIFNALNSIESLMVRSETIKASEYLSQFALMMRLTLRHSKKAVASLDETVEYLHAYLGIEQLRFGHSFCYLIETPDNDKGTGIDIPTLMLQPLVENAIWHGLIPKTGDKMLVIRFAQINDMVTCTITDNGIGIRQSQLMKQFPGRRQAGLKNLRNRIRIMNDKYSMNCSLEIRDIQGKDIRQTGTSAVLKFKELSTLKNENLCGL